VSLFIKIRYVKRFFQIYFKLIKPNEMCNPQVDDLSMMTYLSRFPNAKLKPGAPVQAGGGAKKPAPAAGL